MFFSNSRVVRSLFIKGLAAGVAAEMGILVAAVPALAAPKPTPAQALELTPLQEGVDIEQPAAAEIEKCQVNSEGGDSGGGWIVLGANGRTLRRFSDTNRDGKVDQWCYYKDGVEVYRDVDQNFNGKADQYRWMGTLGSKWGLDHDEDGHIDSWKSISAEEVTAEVMAAVRDGDQVRFECVLLTEEEIKSLGAGPEMTKQLADKAAGAASGFAGAVRGQKVLAKNASWLQFGASPPCLIPEGTSGSTKDLIVYENVAAIVDNAGKHGQLSIGSLVKLGDSWRVIDLPTNLGEAAQASASQNFFFANPAAGAGDVAAEEPANTGLSEAAQRLMAEYEKLERALDKAKPQDQVKINARRLEIIGALAQESKSAEERLNWNRQLADTLSAAAQTGSGEALKKLDALYQKLAASPEDKQAAAHARFAWMNADYTRVSQDPKADYEKVQEKWVADLEGFVKEYGDSEDAAEAMLSLAIAKEFAGQEDDAKTWYARIVSDFPQHGLAKKAAGAKRRLEAVGQSLALRGTTVDNKRFDLSAYNGRIVLVHYWATWCEPCKKDIVKIKELQAKYAKQGFSPVGIPLDADAAVLSKYLTANRMPWPQVYEAGGLESRLAIEMGILTLPTMILIDEKGKVISRNLHVGELETELGKRLK